MKKHRVLIVDDQVFEAEMEFAMPLKSLENVEVLDIVSSYVQAMKAIDRYSPSLVICDVQLQSGNPPNADGVLVAQELENRDIPFFLVTAYPDSYFDSHVLPFKPRYFFHKPIRPEYLSNMVRLVLNSLDEVSSDLEQGQLVYNRLHDWFSIKTKDGAWKKSSADIVYFQADGNYTSVFTVNEGSPVSKLVTLSISIGDVESILKPLSQFLRVSRSIILNLHKVERFGINGDGYSLIGVPREGNEKVFKAGKTYLAEFHSRMRGA
jgi:DNA-binding LytR/AlgR family response regulator